MCSISLPYQACPTPKRPVNTGSDFEPKPLSRGIAPFGPTIYDQKDIRHQITVSASSNERALGYVILLLLRQTPLGF